MKNLEDIVALGGRSDMRRHRMSQVYRFGLKIGWRWFTGLSLKTGGASGVAGWRWRRTRSVIVKLASRRSKIVKAACPSGGPVKTWTVLPPRGVWVLCLMERHFSHLPERLYIESGWLREDTSLHLSFGDPLIWL